MTADEYREQVRQLSAALGIARQVLEVVDLDEIGRQLERADSLGVMLDPTAWIRANDSGSLEAQRELVRWARETRNAFARLQPFARRTLESGT